MRSTAATLFAAAAILALCTSCYSMPTDEDFCLIPTANNPTVTKQKEPSLIPSTSY